jgi:hypothetical protein
LSEICIDDPYQEIDIYDLSEELKNEIDEIIKDIGKGLYVFKEVR